MSRENGGFSPKGDSDDLKVTDLSDKKDSGWDDID